MRIFIFLISLIFVYSCQKNAQTSNQDEQAFTLLKTKCYTCHTPNGSMSQRLAPPMEAVKRHYISSETTKEEFTNEVVGFVLNPSLSNSKMRGAINRFGLMPQLNFEESELKQIAEFLYTNEIEKPEWFEEHFKGQQNETRNAQEVEDDLLSQGQKIAMATKAVLGKNLMNALNKGGTAEAVPFCNIKAIPLTDSMSVALKAKISRVSDKPRNPANKASVNEVSIINGMKSSLAKGEEMKPQLIETEHNTIAYYPITTNAMCLQCHGKKLSEETALLINQKYPDDLATGYDENELRGLWRVVMTLND